MINSKDWAIMGLDDFVNTFGRECKRRYGQRIRKLTINAKFTCPNRDGNLGRGGCTFCNVNSFSSPRAASVAEILVNGLETQSDSILGISEQLAQGKLAKTAASAKGKAKYIAYFQAYTSTYEEYQSLKTKYDEAVKDADIVGLHIGTRPDCVPDEVLALLAEYQMQGIDVWLELGLQTSNEASLKRINRGHGFSQYKDAVERARAFGLKVCTHLILGLPGETFADYLASLQAVLALGVDGLKIHPLHIVEGSTMAKQWRYQGIPLLSKDEYAQAVGELIRYSPKEIIFHRVTAYAKKPMLLAPDWCSYRWDGLVAIVDDLKAKGGQGHYVTSHA
jgi:radical SAM protein (TIGR01212 family)